MLRSFWVTAGSELAGFSGGKKGFQSKTPMLSKWDQTLEFCFQRKNGQFLNYKTWSREEGRILNPADFKRQLKTKLSVEYWNTVLWMLDFNHCSLLVSINPQQLKLMSKLRLDCLCFSGDLCRIYTFSTAVLQQYTMYVFILGTIISPINVNQILIGRDHGLSTCRRIVIPLKSR